MENSPEGKANKEEICINLLLSGPPHPPEEMNTGSPEGNVNSSNKVVNALLSGPPHPPEENSETIYKSTSLSSQTDGPERTPSKTENVCENRKDTLERSERNMYKNLKIVHTNVNEWTTRNVGHELRCMVLGKYDADLICVNEMHLRIGEEIIMPGYRFVSHPRTQKEVLGFKPHGGVGILVKDKLHNQYKISMVYKDYEGILGLRLVHREHSRIMHIYSTYLPPENSKYGRDSNSFFYELLTELYKYNDVDEFIMVDLNAHNGDHTETCYTDTIPTRIPLEKVKNNHSNAFIEFLIDSKCCVVNGRKGDDDYTYMSTRGKSDYVYIPHDSFESIENFWIDQYIDIIDKIGCHHLLEGRGRIPDHGIINLK